MFRYVIGIIGSRDFYNRKILDSIMEELNKKYKLNELDLYICSGGAKGADGLAQSYAKENGVSMIIYYPDWNKFGRGAGIKRNQMIASQSDLIIALWNGTSKGTANTISVAEELEKKIIIYNELTDEITVNYTGGIL